MLLIPFFVLIFSSLTFAAGGFEKPVLWSARAAQHGGAYVSSVEGAEALYFNPASIISADRKQFHAGMAAVSGTVKAPVVNEREKVSFAGPVTPLGMMYSQEISEREAMAVGLYSIGGLDSSFKDVDLTSQGAEFANFRPDIYGRLAVIELGLGYSRKMNENISLGGTLRNHIARAGFSQVQVSQAQGLGGFGIPDGTVLAISQGEFKDLEGSALGAYMLAGNYQNDKKDQGVSVVYRSKVAFTLETKGKGKVVYSNAGAAASGANAGQVYKLSGNNTKISSGIPEAWTASYFKKFTPTEKLSLEYTWTEYSDNQKLGIKGSLTNPVDGSTTAVPDVPLKWKDMHDFKIGWTSTSIESWTIGGGYSLTLPVTEKKHTGPTFAVPGNYHHLYAGAGKAFTDWRIDSGVEYYYGQGRGSTKRIEGANQVTPSVKGQYETEAYAFYLSTTLML